MQNRNIAEYQKPCFAHTYTVQSFNQETTSKVSITFTVNKDIHCKQAGEQPRIFLNQYGV